MIFHHTKSYHSTLSRITLSHRCTYFIILYLFLLLTACSKTPDAEIIHQHIEQMQDALEKKQADELIDTLHPGFNAQQSMTRDQLKAMLIMQFMRHKNINITLVSHQTTFDPVYEYRAETSGTAIVTGADGLLPDDGRIYHFTLGWQKLEDDWLLKELEWK